MRKAFWFYVNFSFEVQSNFSHSEIYKLDKSMTKFLYKLKLKSANSVPRTSLILLLIFQYLGSGDDELRNKIYYYTWFADRTICRVVLEQRLFYFSVFV